MSGHIDVVNLLIQSNASLNIADIWGYNALMFGKYRMLIIKLYLITKILYNYYLISCKEISF